MSLKKGHPSIFFFILPKWRYLHKNGWWTLEQKMIYLTKKYHQSIAMCALLLYTVKPVVGLSIHMHHRHDDPSILYEEILCNDPFFYIFILNRQSPCPSTLIEYQNPSHESIFILCFYILKSLLIHTYVILFHEYNESIRLKSLAFSQWTKSTFFLLEVFHFWTVGVFMMQ